MFFGIFTVIAIFDLAGSDHHTRSTQHTRLPPGLCSWPHNDDTRGDPALLLWDVPQYIRRRVIPMSQPSMDALHIMLPQHSQFSFYIAQRVVGLRCVRRPHVTTVPMCGHILEVGDAAYIFIYVVYARRRVHRAGSNRSVGTYLIMVTGREAPVTRAAAICYEYLCNIYLLARCAQIPSTKLQTLFATRIGRCVMAPLLDLMPQAVNRMHFPLGL